jgi:putative transposase
MSTSYHPQTDGLTERFHRSVEQILRCYCSSKQNNWCLMLSQAEYALNATYQEGISNIPFKVVYGFNPTLPLDTIINNHKVPAVADVVAARRSI